MARMDRRRLLKLSGAGAVAAGTGGIAAILAAGRAPAFAQGTTLHWVRGSDYVPVSDQTLRTKINEQAQKDLGIKFNLEGVDGLTIQARVTSAVQSGNGPDIISAINNWAQLYAESVADVSDVAEEIGKAQGGYYETSKAIAYDGTKWIAVPNTIVGLQPRVMVERNRLRAGKISGNLGRMARGRQEAEGQGASARSDIGPRLWRRERVLVPLSLVVGRQGGRSGRQDGCAQ
jgi:ABC-type glycerol-3-phosphate transport system substrate-binding protein